MSRERHRGRCSRKSGTTTSFTPKPGKQTILYIDLHLVHEVTSPQAFEGLRLAGRKVRRPERTVATADHNVPTTDRSLPILDPISKQQIDTLRNNCQRVRHPPLRFARPEAGRSST